MDILFVNEQVSKFFFNHNGFVAMFVEYSGSQIFLRWKKYISFCLYKIT